jgi:hypothetical protein
LLSKTPEETMNVGSDQRERKTTMRIQSLLIPVILVVAGSQLAAQDTPMTRAEWLRWAEKHGEQIHISDDGSRRSSPPPVNSDFFEQRRRARSRAAPRRTDAPGRRGGFSRDVKSKAFFLSTRSQSPNAAKSPRTLAHGIIQTQLVLLKGWETALANFETVLSHAPDGATSPDLRSAIKTFVQGKVLGELLSRVNVVGVGDAFQLFQDLQGELDRADRASRSASLRSFVVEYRNTLATLQQAVGSSLDDFLHRVEMTEKRGAPESVTLKWELVDALDGLDQTLKGSDPKVPYAKQAFRQLCEMWIRQSTVGHSLPAHIQIEVNEDLSLREVVIIAPGGEQIRDQLLKDGGGKVDVFGMAVRRQVLLYGKSRIAPRGVVFFRPDGLVTLHPSYGGSEDLAKAVRRQGLPPATKEILKGQDRLD